MNKLKKASEETVGQDKLIWKQNKSRRDRVRLKYNNRIVRNMIVEDHTRGQCIDPIVRLVTPQLQSPADASQPGTLPPDRPSD